MSTTLRSAYKHQPAPDAERTAVLRERLQEQRVQFEFSEPRLVSGAETIIRSVVRLLGDHPGSVVSIEGHCDSRGSEEINDTLSVQRAQVVYRLLVEKGVSASRLRVVGHGKSRPIAGNDTAEGRAKNRRVEFVVVEQRAEAGMDRMALFWEWGGSSRGLKLRDWVIYLQMALNDD